MALQTQHPVARLAPAAAARAPAQGRQGLGAAPPLAEPSAGGAGYRPRRLARLVYIVALVLLLITAFWTVDSFTGEIHTEWTLDNIVTVLTGSRLPDGHPAHAVASRSP